MPGSRPYTTAIEADRGFAPVDYTIEVVSYTGFCPTCEWVEISGEAAGTISHLIATPVDGVISTDVSYPGPEGGAWDRDNVSISSPSDPVMD